MMMGWIQLAPARCEQAWAKATQSKRAAVANRLPSTIIFDQNGKKPSVERLMRTGGLSLVGLYLLSVARQIK
jgi:hypothetical protein